VFFTIVDQFREIPAGVQNAGFLVIDYWDDWFSFRTMFSLWLFDEQGARHQAGSVKIGQHGLLPSRGAAAGAALPADTRFPNLAQTFDALDERFFHSVKMKIITKRSTACLTIYATESL
jgi:hypothetical protein